MNLSLEANTNLFFSFHSDSRLKEAGESLKLIAVGLGCQNDIDFATMLGVRHSSVKYWLNGTRRMSKEGCVALQKVVDEAVSRTLEDKSHPDNFSRWDMPSNIPYERIENLWMVARLLNEANSEVTFLQVLDCLED